jgi:hypothetical protein
MVKSLSARPRRREQSLRHAQDIFEKGTESPTQPGVRSVKIPGAVPQPQQVEGAGLNVLSEEAIIVGKIKLTPDVRTNRIHVVTRPINMPFIRQLIQEFDANVEFAKPVTRYLQYVSAGDVLPVLVQALTEPGSEGAGAVLVAGCLARVRNRSNNNEEAPAILAEQTHIHPNLAHPAREAVTAAR